MEAIFYILWAILVCSIVGWFFLCDRLFKVIEARHPDTFDALGRPGLIKNNSLANTLALLRFLFRGRWRLLNDPQVSALSKSIVALLAVYLLAFLLLCIATPLIYSPTRLMG